MKKQTTIPNYRAKGVVFTRPEVVAYMIHEAMHTGCFEKLSGLRILEPSCGEGAFVLPIIDILVAENPDWNNKWLAHFLNAFDISEESISHVKNAVAKKLGDAGCPEGIVNWLLEQWFHCEDYLLHDFDCKFDIIIGNPPYIRFDTIDEEKHQKYKTRFKTFSERCDIYVPFFEYSLSLLSEQGVFSFICSNRFVRSSYGKRLRRMICNGFHVALYLNMEHTQPFYTEVSAYPAIFVIDKRLGRETYSGNVTTLTENTLQSYSTEADDSALNRFGSWYSNDEPWIATNSAIRSIHEKFANIFPTIEQSGFGTQIGIGVATGADDIFLNPQLNSEIEAACLLPIVASDDILDGRISWHNRYILNPYDQENDNQMRNLAMFPKTQEYLNTHSERLKSRYCVKTHPNEWYRTLDRIKYSTLKAAKILIPDIQCGGNVALDETGSFYPHHNIYWITSSSWNLRVLCVLLRSSFVTDQIRCISVQMRGGSIRYQAQYLRNVHIPTWDSLDNDDITSIADLYSESDITKIDACINRVINKAISKQSKRLVQQEFNF